MTIILFLRIFFLNHPINIPLNPRHLKRPMILCHLDRLGDELRVRNILAELEDTHNGGLILAAVVHGDALVAFLVLGGRLFELHHVGLDTMLGFGKVFAEGEGFAGVDVAAFRVFDEGAVFGAGDGLEGAVEFVGSCGGYQYLGL